jgi:hypothetical protein
MFHSRRIRLALVTVLAVVASLAAGAPAGGSDGAPAAPAAGSATPTFDRHNFSHPATIDNIWLPLVPGTQFTLDGNVDGTPHRVVLIVTDLVKVIDGVRSVVLFDRDFDSGTLVEAELAFQAQDDGGTVWNLGEYPELYEDGRFVGAPDTWISGIEEARAGIHMLARPRVGTPSYVQGEAPAIDFLDVGKVTKTGQHVCNGSQCYDNVLVIDETSPLDPDSGHQLKFYAPNVGNIRIAPVGGEQQEFLALTSVTRLNAAALARARLAALLLEVRAYLVSDVYRHTPPARLR